MRSSERKKEPQRPGTRLPLFTVLLGFGVRLVLAPYTSDTYDVAPWFHTSLAGYFGLHLYDRPGFAYPPIWGYVLLLLGQLVRWLGGAPDYFGVTNQSLTTASSTTGDFSDVVTSPAFNVEFKIALFVIDFLTAVLIFRLIYQLTHRDDRARLAFTIWFLNPFVIYQSAIHGAPDVLVGFSVLASVTCVLYGKAVPAGVFWMLGVLTKLAPAVLLAQFAIALLMGTNARQRSAQARISQAAGFGASAVLTLLLFLTPELTFGSVYLLTHNVFARASEGIVVGGLSVFGLRYLTPWSWMLEWAYNNSPTVLRFATVAQVTATVCWGIWTILVIRKTAAFGLLAGITGTLASFTILSPVSNPQYALWWLPSLTVLVVLSRRGHVQLAVVSLAALAFSIAVLGPIAILAPYATYTHFLPAGQVSVAVTTWYLSPGTLWGASRGGDFLGPASLITVAALFTLFATWLRMALERATPTARITQLPRG